LKEEEKKNTEETKMSVSTGTSSKSIMDPNIVVILDAWKVLANYDSISSDLSSTSVWGSIVVQMNRVLATSKQHKDSAVATRKILSESTKALKKQIKTCETSISNSPIIDESVNQCKITIKSYQEEIDVLTRRCKAYEQLYQTLVNDLLPPDPTMCISYVY
jgi:hypothetical protein